MMYLHAQRVLAGLKETTNRAVTSSSAVDIRTACWKVGSIVLMYLSLYVKRFSIHLFLGLKVRHHLSIGLRVNYPFFLWAT
jgi:hypothetical protein